MGGPARNLAQSRHTLGNLIEVGIINFKNYKHFIINTAFGTCCLLGMGERRRRSDGHRNCYIRRYYRKIRDFYESRILLPRAGGRARAREREGRTLGFIFLEINFLARDFRRVVAASDDLSFAPGVGRLLSFLRRKEIVMQTLAPRQFLKWRT